MFDDSVTADADDAVRLSAIMGFFAGFIFFAVLLSLFKGELDSVWFCLMIFIPSSLIGIWGVSKLVTNLKLKNFGRLYAFYRNTKGANNEITLEKQHEIEKEALRKKIFELENELQAWESAGNRWKDWFAPVCSVLGSIIENTHKDNRYKITKPKFKEEVKSSYEGLDELGSAISLAWKHVPERVKNMDGRPEKTKKYL